MATRQGFLLVGVMVLAGLAVACAPVSKLPKVDSALAEIEEQKQRELVLKDNVAQYQRLQNISFKIMAANADICGEVTRYGSGIQLGNASSFGKEFKPAVTRVFGFGEALHVTSVARGSPGDEAGLIFGDVLVSINDWETPVGKGASGKAAKKFQELSKENKAIDVLIVRKGEKRRLTLRPTKVCDYGVILEYADIVNAFADGENIIVATGMMRFVSNDNELAVVVAHEVAHNQMGHIDKKEGNAAIGLIFDILFAGLGVSTGGLFSDIGAQAYSEDFEAEADYVGLYMMARADYPIDEAPNFWRRMAVSHPGSIKNGLGASHPATPERYVALDKTVEEIDMKRSAGLSLKPEVGYVTKRTKSAKEKTPFGN